MLNPVKERKLGKLKSKYENWFIYHAFRQSKLIGTTIVLFIILQLFFTIKGVETFPFNNYGMYSHRYQPKDTFQFFTFHGHNGDPKGVNDFSEGYLTLNQSFRGYMTILENQGIDTITGVINSRFKDKVSDDLLVYLTRSIANQKDKWGRYPVWAKNYFKKLYNEELFCVLRQQVYYTNEYSLLQIKADTVWKNE